jgi:hypothetical protein
MKRKQMYIVAGLLVVLLGGLTFVAAGALSEGADEPVEAAGPVERLFGMRTHEVLISEVPSDECPYGQAVIEGSGNAGHLGKVTLTRSHCVDPNRDISMFDGWWEAMAANGDSVWGSYFGRLAPTEFDDQGNPVRGIITSPYTLDGGTGRFEGASGEGIATGDLNLASGEGAFQTDGWIWY